MTDAERAKRIAYMDAQIKMSELYAHYWIAMATTGTATRRKITDGSGRQFTNREKIAEALNTARQHIDNLRETTEARAGLFLE